MTRLTPPAWMTAECARSPVSADTIGDALALLPVIIEERDACADQVDALRSWGDEQVGDD